MTYECKACGLVWTPVALTPGTAKARAKPRPKYCGCGLRPPPVAKDRAYVEEAGVW